MTNNTLSTNYGPCLVDVGPLSLINKGFFFFEKNVLVGGSPQLQFGEVSASDTCKMIVDNNIMRCQGGPCRNSFFWFRSLIALTGTAEFSVSNNNCTGADISFQPLLVLVSALITPCLRCSYHFCFNNLFGKLLDSSDALSNVISAILSAFMMNCVAEGAPQTGEPFPSSVAGLSYSSGLAVAMALMVLAVAF